MRLRIVAEALVEVQSPPELPESLEPADWFKLDEMVAAGDYWEMLVPSQFTETSEALRGLVMDLGVARRCDPLSILKELNQAIYEWFEYVPKSTRVDSPIDQAIESRKGVCQDFAHIMIATGASDADSVPVRERVFVSARGFSGPVAGWCEPRVGGSAAAGVGMGRVRSDQQFAGRGAAYPDGDRPRLCGCSAD